MSQLDQLIQDFLSQKIIAVVGVSDRRDTGCNAAFKRFSQNGYRVFAINPRISTFEGQPCYPDLTSLPEKPDAVFILARPAVTDQIIQQSVDLGVRHVWMHCMMGVKPGLASSITSVSLAALELCAKNAIAVIPGSCPNQYLAPDLPHRLMNRLWSLFGFLKLANRDAIS